MARGESFEREGVRIVYDDLRPNGGGGEPIVLVHGFASNRANNWADTGWYETLLDLDRRVVALDNRGHGESDKRYDPAAYDLPTMARDVVGLLDHLDVPAADYFGYSMGGRIGLELLQRHPERVTAAVLGGVGGQVVTDSAGDREGIARALEAEDPEAIDHQVGRDFRVFAEATGADREALAAVIRAHGDARTDHELSRIGLPVLVAAGDEDDIVGDPVDLAAEFPNAEAAIVPEGDHLSTVPDGEFVAMVTDFLDRKGR
jgi:pimeloyl-ACP methyl ester carboxylesterase